MEASGNTIASSIPETKRAYVVAMEASGNTIAEDAEAAEAGSTPADSASFAITEPSMDGEMTAEKEASMASVLAAYRETLVKRSKYQLGKKPGFFFLLKEKEAPKAAMSLFSISPS